jgi:Tfp pilus assembly protein PilW
MVAVAIGLFLTVAMLVMQLKLIGQNTNTGDVRVRDNESRAALSLITNDLDSAGFLLSGLQYPCYGLLTYNPSYPGGNYQVFYPVWGLSGASGLSLPFVVPGGGNTAGITLNYPSGANRSDVLVIAATINAVNFAPTSTPSFEMDDGAVAYKPTADGVLPLKSTTPADGSDLADVAVGDQAIVLAPNLTLPKAALSRSGRALCMRVPVGAKGASTITASGATMPPNSFAGYATQVASTGTTTPLVDAYLLDAKIVDVVRTIAAPAVPNQRWLYVYFVDAPPGSVPTLVRATIDATTDQELPNTRLQIASGVVSFQVMFGVDTTGGGAVTAYQSGSALAANKTAGYVRSVKLAIVTRTLFDDPDAKVTSVAIPNSSSPDADFTAYTPAASEQKRHYSVSTVEIPLRN